MLTEKPLCGFLTVNANRSPTPWTASYTTGHKKLLEGVLGVGMSVKGLISVSGDTNLPPLYAFEI
jgi:hypothetical protein